MRSIWLLAGGLAVALAPTGCQPGAEAPPEEATETAPMSDDEMLEAQLEAFEAAWESTDANAIGAMFVAEGDLIGPAGDMHHGREAIVARYQELFQTIYQGTSVSLSRTSTRFLTPEVAVTDGAFEITGMKADSGESMTAVTGLYTSVAVKKDGKWQLHCSRPMMPVKASGT